MSPCCDLGLEESNFFRATLWLMMLPHHTKFGNKMFGGSEDIIWTNIHQHFENFAVTLTLNTVIQFFNRTLQFMMLYYHTMFGCKWTSCLGDE